MKRIEKIQTIIICGVFSFFLVVVAMLFILKALFPSGDSDIKIIRMLMSRIPLGIVKENDWIIEYPFIKEQSVLEKYENSINSKERYIEQICSSSIPGQNHFEKYSNLIKGGLLNYDVDKIGRKTDSLMSIDEIVESVTEFSDKLNDANIPFIYAHTPTVKGSEYYLYNEKSVEAEKADQLIKTLSRQGIRTINMPERYAADKSASSEGPRYDVSVHWFPEETLHCMPYIVKELNEFEGFDLDAQAYNLENYRNALDDNESLKKEIQQAYGYEYYFPTPRDDDYRYEMVISEKETIKGNFEETLLADIDNVSLNDGAYHGISRINNTDVYEITNHDAKCDKKVLLIGDSFAWPIAEYLSVQVENVDFITRSSFNGSIMSYINKHNPDVVLMCYIDREAVNWDVTQFYDLR